MAGNSNSGRSPTFPLSEKELREKIEQYKADLDAGAFARASWPHFCAYQDATESDLAMVIGQGANKDSAYRGRTTQQYIHVDIDPMLAAVNRMAEARQQR